MDQRASNPTALVMGGPEWVMLASLAVLWGGSFFFFKIMVAALPPFTVVLARVGLAALILNLWLALRRASMPLSIRTWVAFLVMGLLNNVVPFTLIVFGETQISIGLASILNATTPMFTVLAAHWFTKNEKLTISKLVGMASGFAGVTILIGPEAFRNLGGIDVVGELACILAAISYAFAGIYGRRLRSLNPIKVATGQITASTVVLLPLVGFVDKPWTLVMPGGDVWGAMAGIAVLCTAVAYILYFRILATAGATNLLLVTFLVPMSALLLGWLVLGESVAPRAFAGMALIGSGLAALDGRVLPVLFLTIQRIRSRVPLRHTARRSRDI